MTRTAGEVLIAGSIIFGIGAAVGVPRVFTAPDRETRLRLLEQQRTAWQIAQPFYGIGPAVAGVGVGLLAVDDAISSSAKVLCLIAAVALLVGAGTWSYSCYLRGAHPADFALGKLPGWPFATYVVLTIAGLALFGAGLLVGDYPGWLGWSVLTADLAFLTLYAVTKDIPPFLFYIVLMVAGAVLV
jgi:hypothetical protein